MLSFQQRHQAAAPPPPSFRSAAEESLAAVPQDGKMRPGVKQMEYHKRADIQYEL
jgi:hypothetical protein